MEVLLAVRICSQPSTDAEVLKEINITESDVIEDVSKSHPFLNLSLPYLKPKVSDFTASAKIVQIGQLQSHAMFNAMADKFKLAALVDINLNCSYEQQADLPPTNLSNQHTFIVQTVRNRYEINEPLVEIITVTNHYDKTVSTFEYQIPNNMGSRYQLYVNNILITEKFYPYNIDSYFQLEERVLLNLDPGSHTVSIKSFGNNKIHINAMKFQETVVTDIDVSRLSFQIQ